MIEDLELDTYLSISPNKFGIYLFDKKNLNNFYKNEIELNNPDENIDLNNLENFLENNIFKIEKLTGKFVKNIFIIIETKKINNVSIGLKKINDQEKVSTKILENVLIDAKEIFKKNYYNKIIMHMVINNYFIDGTNYKFFEKNLVTDYFCLEVKFIFISKIFLSEIEKVLEKYQIKINECLDANYINNLFSNSKIEISQMAHNVRYGFNSNEVKLIKKNTKKLGFFEKFFQLFS